MNAEKEGRNEFFELGQFNLRKETISRLDKDFCLKHEVVFLKEKDQDSKYAFVGMFDPENKKLQDKLRHKLGCKIKAVQLNEYEIAKALCFGFFDDVCEDEYVLNLQEEREIHFSSDQQPKDMLDDLLSQAVNMNATDVHIEIYNDDVDLRYRIDGILHQVSTPLSPDNIKKVLGRIKVMSDLDLAEHRKPQDGKLRTSYSAGDETRKLDIRVSLLPSTFGENVVLRILDSERDVSNFEDIGLSDQNIRIIREKTSLKNGLILFTGPTGSGKTTSLYSVIKEINTPGNKIITVEDPIEYEIPKVSQYQVDSRMGFADFAKASLRHDPDIMVIGEIRDEETANLALRASSTGHLVLSTMHTNDAISVIGRFRDFGVPESFIAENLRLSMSQRLFRKVCQKCAGKGAFTENLLEKKCPDCFGIGYKGRSGIFELFTPDETIKSMICDGKSLHEIRAQYNNRETLEFAARQKVDEGITDLEEMSKVIKLESSN